ncbi:pyridoxamine 5'-phosphate oxidase family protein [Candidatus Thiothrix sp. Deng01]|uniref:Pyridoxamine 5'-phosphate oxidase family protein n=1 Tax=Candidatus Thiothrix phosphatis TaxID=3112415 RepID=A0ABU6D1X9_9GAMM|nr:pyridoxamine 5'-phosphate oxidase family protein [Candidatus Thiothrix sp. Deng01]MEB4593066.1 pyridoxamine 5'-phosphate oxidase family protein [Candidatus Thiothrix sp. Deng01]
MSYGFLDIAMTPSVRAVQKSMQADDFWFDFKGQRAFDRFSENEARFIAERDSFYMATVSESGWPYVQHRGGPRGFLKLVDERTLACADFRGNRQYISVGNAVANDRACLFLMDYAHRARLKMYVRIEVVALEADPELAQLVSVPGYKARVERILRMRLEAFDWNCPQHITPRFTEEEVAAAVLPLRERLQALEAENAELRAKAGVR